MKGKTQERVEGGSRKRSSSPRSEKMDRVGDRYKKKMEEYFSTGQSKQWAAVPMEGRRRRYRYLANCTEKCL
jgi:hypothetical protein